MPSNNRESIFKTNQNQNSNDGGSSGSFFFFSQDKQFIVKTISFKELMIYLNGLPKFLEHFKKGGSLLARIYGIFKV
jgi:hypothetical protein